MDWNATARGVHLSLRAKLSAGFLAVTLCCAVIAGALVDRNVRSTTLATFEDRLSYETTMLGQMTAGALFGEIDPSDTSLNESIHVLGKAVHTELSLIAKDGTVVANSEADDPHSLGSQASAPEVVAAREKGGGTVVRAGRMYVARAIVRDGKTLGFARSSVPMADVTGYVLGVRWRMAYGSAIALLVAVVLGFIFSSQLVRPIRALSQGARRVGAGDFDHTIEVRSKDEIGELASSFNDMTRSLRHTVAMLDGRNRDMRIVLDNVTEGLLTIDRAGAMSREKSAVLDKWFGTAPQGTSFVDYIRRSDVNAAQNFALQWDQLLEGVLPLSLLLDQLPKRLVRSNQLFQLSYTPITDGNDSERVDNLLVLISDVTARVAAERAEAEQREVACILERATRDKSGVLEFLLTAEAQVRELTAETRPALVDTQRTLHTLKGNGGLFGMHRLATLCHEIETRMAESGGDMSTVDIGRLESAWTRTAGSLSSLLGNTTQVVIEDEEFGAVLRAILDGSPRHEVARMVSEWRMERAGDRLERYADQVRDLAQRLQKGTIRVEVAKSSLRLPREAWAPFWTVFAHVVRNAVDHGIEPEEERLEAGKPIPAWIRLAATRTDQFVILEIADDGRGIDWDTIAARAASRGLPAKRHEDLVAALFVDGLSSKQQATTVSGRGVGLGAIKAACEKLGGYVTVDSEPRRGSTFRFHIPLPDEAVSLRPTRETVRPTPAPNGA
jgi:two-component system, chemotaxis family, sensor kinase CheA